MNKEVFIALIQKDIRELDMIAQGLYETELPSPTIIKLAACKAQDVISNLQKLAEVKHAEPKTIAVITENPIHVTDEEPLKPEPVIETSTTPTPSIVFEVSPEITEEEIVAEAKAEEISTTISPIVEDIQIEEPQIEEPIATATERIPEETEPVVEEIILENIDETVSIIEETQIPEETIEIKEEAPVEAETLEIEIEAEETTETEIEALTAVETELEEIQEQLAETSTALKGILSKSKEKGFVGALFNKKIESIRKSISMGDRFRFQRDLFGNNIDAMNKAIDALDNCKTAEEAEIFISSNFDWNPEKETVADFLNLVSRKF